MEGHFPMDRITWTSCLPLFLDMQFLGETWTLFFLLLVINMLSLLHGALVLLVKWRVPQAASLQNDIEKVRSSQYFAKIF